PADPLSVLAEAGRPSAGHEKLQPLAGRWTYTAKLWFEPGKSPVETKGTIERKWILGGRFLEQRVAGTGIDGKPGFEAFGLIGYDNAQKKYTSTCACTMCTGSTTGVGVAESPDKFTFHTTCFCPVLKETVKGRDEIRIENDNKTVMEGYKYVGGKEVKVLEI